VLGGIAGSRETLLQMQQQVAGRRHCHNLVCNSLPVPVTSAATLNTFKQRLKTELFIRCYDLPSSYARKHSV